MQNENSTLLSRVKTPHDLNKLSYQELKTIANEIRQLILQTTSKNGGHLSSNLGVVELTIAIHRIFDSPNDTIVWDVGHQCYTHKLLTGRVKHFDTIRCNNGLSGFPKITESSYDAFGTGHASTSVSAAVGISTAKQLLKKQGFSIAVIGDGALTGGLAFEGIANACSCTKNLVVILNDNGFSISKNKSYFSKHLSSFSISHNYLKFKFLFSYAMKKIPILGERFLNFLQRLKDAVKTFSFSSNFFIDFGFKYVGPINGHNIKELESILKKVKTLNAPVVVHVKTKKGYGYSYAEKDPSSFHGVGHFDVTDGKLEPTTGKSFSSSFSQAICTLAHKNPNIVAITAAMLDGTGLSQFSKAFPERCFDVGIAEEHAVTFAAGLATSGLQPCVAIYSTFLQRAIDQIIHDVALQNLPVVFAIDRAGAVPNDGATHQGSFDISLLRPIPNMTILSPASDCELKLCLEYAFAEKTPIAIRYPKATCPDEIESFNSPMVKGKGVFLEITKAKMYKANTLIVLCTGGLFSQVKTAIETLHGEGIEVDLYSLRFIKPLDTDYFLSIVKPYSNILLLEEGTKIGGIATELETLIAKNEPQKRTTTLAFPDAFFEQASRAELLSSLSLSSDSIINAVKVFQ